MEDPTIFITLPAVCVGTLLPAAQATPLFELTYNGVVPVPPATHRVPSKETKSVFPFVIPPIVVVEIPVHVRPPSVLLDRPPPETIPTNDPLPDTPTWWGLYEVPFGGLADATQVTP